MKARRILRHLQNHQHGFELEPVPTEQGMLSPDRPNAGRFVRFVDGAYVQRRLSDL
jgi:hypothetical protein